MNRRYDLDWLRIGAFGLLILYHIGMVFVPWDFHIKTAHTVRWLEAPMLLLNAWRLPLLFLISGVASRLMLAKRRAGFAGLRSRRLLVPLIAGMALWIAPQAWVDASVNHGYRGGLVSFWVLDYFRFDASLGITVPTWNQLWFVAYLWIYTMFLAAAARVPERWRAAAQAAFDRAFGGWRLAVLPVAVFALARITLVDRFPESHALAGDWYAHVIYGFAFAFGVGLGGTQRLWLQIAQIWRPAGIVALIAWSLVAVFDLGYPEGTTPDPTLVAVMRTTRAVQCWGTILALLGLAQRYLDHDHPWRTILNEAVFPAYIAHQTVILLVMYALLPLGLPPVVEFGILLTATVAGSVLFYFAGREVSWLRPLIGLSATPVTPRRAMAAG